MNSHFDTFFGQSDAMTSFGPFGCQEPTYVSVDDFDPISETILSDDANSENHSGLSKASKRIVKSPASDNYLPASRRAQKKSNSARNPWTPREDAQLIELMSKYGQSWAMIASCLSGRTGKQVRDRFLNKLRPGVRCGDWSNAEDELVVRLMNQVGHRWSFIATHLPGRTEVQVKNRFYSHIKKRIQPNGVFCQTMSVSNSSQASSEIFSSSAASPCQDAISFDFTQDFDFDTPTENPVILAEQNQTYMAKTPYVSHHEICSELPTQNTSVASQSPAEGGRVDPTDMISYEFPVNSEFCRQFSQPSLFKMTSFQLFQEAAFPAPQVGEASVFHSLEVEAERLSELTKRKALLERALAQTLQELNGSKQ